MSVRSSATRRRGAVHRKAGFAVTIAASVMVCTTGCTTSGGDAFDLAALSEGLEAEVAQTDASVGTTATGTDDAGSGSTSTNAAGSVRAASFAEPGLSTETAPDDDDDDERSLFSALFTNQRASGPSGRGASTRDTSSAERGARGGESALPGVDPDSIFDLEEAENGDPDMVDDVMSLYRTAALRPDSGSSLGSYGLRVSNASVETDCFPAKLVGLLKSVERRFGTKVIVTSGHRSPRHNRLVGGATRSEHIKCNAADIVVPNADRFEVAKFVEALPGRGGVGTYCKNRIIHVDVGRKRSWHWDC